MYTQGSQDDESQEEDLALNQMNLSLKKGRKYHILIEKNKIQFSKECNACNQLFSSELMIKIYDQCTSDKKEITDIKDFNLDKFEIQCLVIQLKKAESILLNKLYLICYELQKNQCKIEKALSKYNIQFPFQMNQSIKSESMKYILKNKYMQEKYEKEQFLRQALFQSIDQIHTIIQNINLHTQLYYKYNQIIDDQSLNNSAKLNELMQLKKQAKNSINIEFDDKRSNFPTLDLGIFYYQNILNKNRSKIIEQSLILFKDYPSISILNSLIYYKLFNSTGIYQPEEIIGDTIDSFIHQGLQINYQSEKLRTLQCQYLYHQGQYQQVIQIGKEVIEKEDPYNSFYNLIIFQSYLVLNNLEMAIKVLQNLYLDKSCNVIILLNKINLYTQDQNILRYSQIQKCIIQFILIHIAYTNLDLASFLYMPDFQHWDLYLE